MDKHDGKQEFLHIAVPVLECAFWKQFFWSSQFSDQLVLVEDIPETFALFRLRNSDRCANRRPALQLCLSEHEFLSGTWFAFRGNRPKFLSRLQESGFPLVDIHKGKKVLRVSGHCVRMCGVAVVLWSLQLLFWLWKFLEFYHFSFCEIPAGVQTATLPCNCLS